MKLNMTILFLFIAVHFSIAQSDSDRSLIERAGMDYIEAFYEGDTTKLVRSIKPSLHKLGFWKQKDSKLILRNLEKNALTFVRKRNMI